MNTRLEFVDLIRGVAIIGVVLFHLVWDLEFTGFIAGIASHPAWLWFGQTLAGTFMFLVGVSLVLAHREQVHLPAFWRRLAIVIGAAATITVLTFFAFPQSYIFFGILHSIAVASLVGILFVKSRPWVCLAIGIFILILPEFINSSILDPRWLAWIGLFANPPASNDFVPFFPWAGLTFLGMGLAQSLNLNDFRGNGTPTISRNHLLRWISWSGRKSLPIYLIHQPVLLAIILPVSWLFRG